MKGKSGIVLGMAVGYVLGTKAGRERYEQLSASARRLADNPSLQRLQEELGNLFTASKSQAGATIEGKVTQAADKAADKVSTARESATATAGGSGGSGTAARRSRSSSASTGDSGTGL